MRRAITAVGLLLSAVCGYLTFGTAAQLATTASQSHDVAAPSHWVPFSADVEITRPTASARLTGRFFRSSNGSSRQEFLESAPLVTIMNVGMNTYFELRRGQWCRHPMGVGPKGYHPLKMREENATLGKRPIQFESLVVRELRNPRTIELIAPELNFFAVTTEGVPSGAKTRYHNIVKGEPDPSLFEPPPAADVVMHQTPMGILENGTQPKLSEIKAEHRRRP